MKKRKETMVMEMKPLLPGLAVPAADIPCQIIPWIEAERYQKRIHQLLELEKQQRQQYAQIPRKAHSDWLQTKTRNPTALASLLLIHFCQWQMPPPLQLPLELVTSTETISQTERVILLVYEEQGNGKVVTLVMVSHPRYSVPVLMDLVSVSKFLWPKNNHKIEWCIKLSELPGHTIPLLPGKCKWAVNWNYNSIWSKRLAKAVKGGQHLMLLEQHFVTDPSLRSGSLKERIKRMQGTPGLINEILRECHTNVVEKLSMTGMLGETKTSFHLPLLGRREAILVDPITLHHLLGLYKIVRLVADRNCQDCIVLLEHVQIPTRRILIQTALATIAFASREFSNEKDGDRWKRKILLCPFESGC